MAGESDSNDYQLYNYSPSLAAAVVFTVLFALVSFLHTYQLARTRIWSFIPFCIGGYFEWIGYIGRAMGAYETPNWTLGPFVLQSVLLLVAPALYAASIYMILGRLIRLTDGQAYSLIRPQWLTKIFVAGDVLSFVMQGAGAAILSSGSNSSMATGEHIIVGGLVVQILFFSLFLIVGVKFNVRMNKKPTEKVITDNTSGGLWQKHLYAIFAGSTLILIRSVFRLVEYAQGYTGYVASHEVYLYVFDALLMFSTMTLYASIHPSEINARLKGERAPAIRRVFSVYIPMVQR